MTDKARPRDAFASKIYLLVPNKFCMMAVPLYPLNTKVDGLKGTWEVDMWCNLEAEVLLEMVSGFQNLDGDLGG